MRAERQAGADRRAAADAQIDVQQMFRLSAVRRPLLDGAGAEHAPAPIRVSEEELVDALWTRRERFEQRLAQEATVHAPLLEFAAVELEDVEPGDGVLVRLRLTVGADGGGVPHSVGGLSAAMIVTVAEMLEDCLCSPVAVSASPEPPAAMVADADAQTTAWDRLTPFLAVLGTSVGVIGFVTFVGGMIVWARVHAAGLPAAPTLGVFPSQDLLVIGAETLVPMVLTGLVVVVALAVIYVLVRAVVRHGPIGHRWTAHEAAFLAGEATLLGAIGMFLFVLLALGIALVLLHDDLSLEQFTFSLVGVAVGAALAAAVGSVTRRFLYLAATTFVLAGVFLGFVAFWSAGNEEMVRGAAVIRENKKAIVGIFVAEGSGRVYLARLTLGTDDKIRKSRSRLVGVVRSQVSDIAIGDRKTPAKALDQAVQLAKELCASQPERAPPASGRIENCVDAPPGKPQP